VGRTMIIMMCELGPIVHERVCSILRRRTRVRLGCLSVPVAGNIALTSVIFCRVSFANALDMIFSTRSS
jgi:hypothetical protein